MKIPGLFIDGFAGGGGASTGIAQALGRDVDIAINHSPSAIAIHKANHPTTEHHCQDIRAIWPAAATRLRPVAGAWFSPDCKEYSKAKGGPVKDRHIRALADEVTVWLRETRPSVAYLENVEEFEYAAPLDEEGIPIKGMEGRAFKRLVRAWRGLGFKVQWRKLKACDYGAPTSRRRLYIIMRCDGLPIVWPKPTHAAANDNRVLAGKLLPYRTAAECIDWSIPCPSIFERKKELAEATKRRIAHGIMRYVVNAASPFIVPVTHQGSVRVHDVAEPMRTVTGAHRGELAAVDVQVAPHISKFRNGAVGSDIKEPMPTVTANGVPKRPAGAMPLGLAEVHLAPHLMTNRNAQKPFNGADEPTHTITAGGAHLNVVEAALVTCGQHGGANRPVDEPHRTIAASKKDTNGVVSATLVRTGHGEVDASGKRRGKGCHDLSEPAPTVTSSRDEALAAATLIQMGYGEREGQKPRVPHIDKPLGTIVAGGGKSGAVTAFLSSFYTSNTNGGRGRPDMPLKTACAGANHHSVVAAHIEQANTGMIGREASRPLSTIVGKGSTQRIVETTMVEEGALPPALLARAIEVAAFLVKYYATDGENEVAQAQPVDRPLDTITTKARFAVVTVTIDAVTYVIVDIGLRMLKPRELARAQGFPDNYVLDPIVEKVVRGKLVERPLTIAEQISAIGNSVCPPVARALVAANQPELTEMRLAA